MGSTAIPGSPAAIFNGSRIRCHTLAMYSSPSLTSLAYTRWNVPANSSVLVSRCSMRCKVAVLYHDSPPTPNTVVATAAPVKCNGNCRYNPSAVRSRPSHQTCPLLDPMLPQFLAILVPDLIGHCCMQFQLMHGIIQMRNDIVQTTFWEPSSLLGPRHFGFDANPPILPAAFRLRLRPRGGTW